MFKNENYKTLYPVHVDNIYKCKYLPFACGNSFLSSLIAFSAAPISLQAKHKTLIKDK